MRAERAAKSEKKSRKKSKKWRGIKKKLIKKSTVYQLREFSTVLKNKKEENGWRYFAISSLYLFINFFDNMLSAENFNLCFFVVCLLLVNDLESKNNLEELST